jgi:hypothetical protein
MINYAYNCSFGCQGKRDTSSYSAGTAGNDNNFLLEIQINKKGFYFVEVL